jgi:Holliday junction resolvasome RuvABC ATP-dependent DNA helicase subunit
MPRPPYKFHNFVGQQKIVQRLLSQAHGAKKRNEPFPHTMIMGPSGLGKTELTHAACTGNGVWDQAHASPRSGCPQRNVRRFHYGFSS